MKTCPGAQGQLSPIENGHGVVRVSDPYETNLLNISSSLKCARTLSTRSIDSLTQLRFGSDWLFSGLLQGARPSSHPTETVAIMSELPRASDS